MWRWIAAAAVVCTTAGLLWMVRMREPPEQRHGRTLRLLRDGDFESAFEEAASAERGSEAAEWRSRFRLLQAEALLDGGKSDAAMALLDSMGDSNSVEHRVRWRVLRARRFISKANLTGAQELLAEAQRILSGGRRTDLQAEVDLLLGQTLARQRRLDDAEALFVRARHAAAATNDTYRLAAAVNNLGMIEMIRSRCDEAIPLFLEAQKLYREAAAKHWVAAAGINIGLCYSQLGDIENAFTYRQAAIGLSRPSLVKANALGETGTVLLADDPAKAAPYYREAREMARRFGALADAARWSGNLASALAATGQWDAAEAALQNARELGPEPRSRVFLDLNAGAIALGRGRPVEARQIYAKAIASSPDNPSVLWQAWAGIAATWIADNDPVQAEHSFEAAIRVIEEAQSDLNRNEHKITFLARLIRLYQDYVDLLMSRGEQVRALAVADRSRARLLSERISRRIGRNSGFSEQDFRATARQSGSIWLSYWVAPKRSFLWAVTPTEVQVFTLPGQQEITSLAKEYRAFIETAMRDPLRTPSEAGRKLYDMLIAPAAPLIPEGSGVTIVPDGPLHQISFDTLPDYQSDPQGYLMERASVAIAPSFGVFNGHRAAAVSGGDALIIGDPVSPAPEFPFLRHAGQEISRVARRMKSGRPVVVTGAAARPEIWKTSNPGRFSTIHIAAHAEANERSPLDSAIILSAGSGYRLYARDIIDVPLSAGLVSLSACRSSGARSYAGEGMVGFAWAFLHAGAHAVIAGLWDVADESTPILMDNLYAGIAAGEPPAAALRKARLALRQTAYAKPFYWGAFQLYTR